MRSPSARTAAVRSTTAATSSAPVDTSGVPRLRAGTADLVEQHLPLVGHLVRQTLSRMPAHVSHDDLSSAGMLALVQAAEAFDSTRGASFATYATARVRGALLDELRGMDWASRSVRRRAREVDDARGRISTALGRAAENHEVAAALGIGTSELAAHQNDLARACVMSLNAFVECSVDDLLPAHTITPADVVEQREQIAYLHDAVTVLPDRLRVVIEGYFFADRPMAELAEELGVSESRISQLRTEAISLLKGALTAALEPERATSHERPTGCAARRKEAYYAGVALHRTYTARLSSPRTLVGASTS